ncbi:MAG TPA: glycosyltransferase family 4 protein [Actinomycetota bacterium]|nr:glycosyltransferase family 4 protein [Actinomycetota bacterium]
MKRVVFHSYYFPPTGGAGAQRPLKLVRYLGDHGYRATVVTAPGGSADRWSPTDTTLDGEVPDSVEVRRVPGPEPVQSSGWRVRGERWLRVRSPWDRWWVSGSINAATRPASDVDLVYVWMQPYNSARAGAELAVRLGRPWVADLGDPWALDEMRIYPSALHRALDAREMRRLLSTAAAIVMSTPEAKSRLLSAFPEFGGRLVVDIPNGYDASDFAIPMSPRSDRAFRIVHTGYLHTALGEQVRRGSPRRLLGGSAPGLDILTRSHVFLIDALERLFARDARARDEVELHLAGVLDDADRRIASRSDAVRLLGYVTHAESIDLIRTADLLFLPMHDLPVGTRATIVPGKTYEYLASGTPILAAVPEGDARDILAAAGNAKITAPNDVTAIANALEAELQRFRSRIAVPTPRRDVVERFEYRALAKRLAGVFDEALERQ